MPKRSRGPNDSLRKKVRAVLKALTPAQRAELRERLASHLSVTRDTALEDIGQDFEETRRRIRELEKRALRKLEERNEGSPRAPERRGPPIQPWSFPETQRPPFTGLDEAGKAGAGKKRRSKHRGKAKRPGRGKRKR